jgi:rubrerythrin
MFEFGIKTKPVIMRELETFKEIKPFYLKFTCNKCGYEFDDNYRCPKCKNPKEENKNV